MVSERQREILRIAPTAISSLRIEFGSAIDQLNEALSHLRRSGYLPGPWLGDESSQQVAAHYTARAMDQPDSSYQALVAYRNELVDVHDTLQRMEAEYLRTDHDESTNLQRRS